MGNGLGQEKDEVDGDRLHKARTSSGSVGASVVPESNPTSPCLDTVPSAVEKPAVSSWSQWQVYKPASSIAGPPPKMWRGIQGECRASRLLSFLEKIKGKPTSSKPDVL